MAELKTKRNDGDVEAFLSGVEDDWFLTGLSPRKQALTVYLMAGTHRDRELFAQLGRHTTGKGCLYIRKLEDIDLDVLERLLEASVRHVHERTKG